MSRTVSASVVSPRQPIWKAVDASAVRAIAQAAVNVELFTIPLYMGALYSIQGTHPINSQGLSYFKGRLWPGAATTAKPTTANEKAFNIIFSVFIQEMLHLQLASNIATAIGLTPNFNSDMLQDPKTYGWICYGPDKTVIPHVVDLRDMDAPYTNLKVNIDALSQDQINLFLAIEEPDDVARKHIVRGNYFPTVPFANWRKEDTEKDLPMFGTIGQLYQCYYDYLNIRYTDGTNLWQYLTAASQQRDLFNIESAGSHPLPEYPGFDAALSSLRMVATMMDAITDQGEGSTLKKADRLLAAVKEKYRSSEAALEQDYPSYTDTGEKAPLSDDAVARFNNDGKDHFERFQEVMGLLDQIVTWPAWFRAGNKWKKEDLQASDYVPDDDIESNLPTTQAVADALNALAASGVRNANHTMFSKVAAGSIAGVTKVLNTYWQKQDPTNPPVAFPSPAMYGSGDRFSICWAVLGEAPDLSLGIDPPTNQLYHACQALDFSSEGNQCAPPAVFHTCIGSNDCKAQGGCGFVQSVDGGHNCATARGTRGPLSAGHMCGGPTVYSAPSDNRCATFGGCAVPISASQIYPKSGKMQLFDFTGDDNKPVKIGTIDFEKGDLVHDVAYRAYVKVMANRKQQVPPNPPPPSQLRLAFPPST